MVNRARRTSTPDEFRTTVRHSSLLVQDMALPSSHPLVTLRDAARALEVLAKGFAAKDQAIAMNAWAASIKAIRQLQEGNDACSHESAKVAMFLRTSMGALDESMGSRLGELVETLHAAAAFAGFRLDMQADRKCVHCACMV